MHMVLVNWSNTHVQVIAECLFVNEEGYFMLVSNSHHEAARDVHDISMA